jgi:hypothetical protein
MGRHVMIPFPNPDDLPAAMEFSASFCLDNGAFSVWKRGGKLDVQGYYRFVEGVMHHPAFDWAIIPDVVDGNQKDNAELISQWPFGHAGVPVWHLHESLDWLRFLSGAWPRIALGSSGQWATPGTDSWWGRMGEAMQAVCGAGGQPRCKLHGLRMLNPEMFTHLPLASADSTNAVRNGNLTGRFGMYPPASVGQRQAVIADRIEAHQSASCWKTRPVQANLFGARV